MVFTFLTNNLLNTTTIAASFTSNTSTSFGSVFDRDTATTFASVSQATSTSTFRFTLNFSSTQTVSKVILIGHNFRDFEISMGGTTITSFSSNSATNHYLSFSTVQGTAFTISVGNVITAGTEKSIAEFFIGDTLWEFPFNPNYQNYDVNIRNINREYEMADGGTIQYKIEDMFESNISLSFLAASDRNNLFTNVFQRRKPFVFVENPTSTAYDGRFYEVIWSGGFGFYKSSNNPQSGFSGSISLKETPKI